MSRAPASKRLGLHFWRGTNVRKHRETIHRTHRQKRTKDWRNGARGPSPSVCRTVALFWLFWAFFWLFSPFERRRLLHRAHIERPASTPAPVRPKGQSKRPARRAMRARKDQAVPCIGPEGRFFGGFFVHVHSSVFDSFSLLIRAGFRVSSLLPLCIPRSFFPLPVSLLFLPSRRFERENFSLHQERTTAESACSRLLNAMHGSRTLLPCCPVGVALLLHAMHSVVFP